MNTTTSEAGGCHCAGIALCSSRTRAVRNMVCQLREDCYLPPINGLLDGILSCSPISSSFNWFLTYSAIRLSFLPTVSTWYPLHQTSQFRYLYFNSPNCSYSIVLLFPFRYPIKCDTDIFGGISMNRWMWLGYASASMIFTPFHSHNCRSIFPMAAFFSR